MSLRITSGRSVVSAKLFGAFFAIFALFVQPLLALNLPNAFAAAPVSGASANVTSANPYESASIDASSYANLTFSFNFDTKELDVTPTVDTLEYGWKANGVEHVLGGIDGVSGASAIETGSKSSPLPSEAFVSGLSVYAKVVANSTNDVAILTNITLDGATVEQNTVCASGCEYTTIGDAVAGEAAGSTITVKAGTYPMTSTVLVNKPLTINGENGAKITTSGSAHVFVTTAPGVTINGLEFEKMDKASQNIINVQGANTTISNNNFHGKYVAADAQSDRALEISTTSGVNISGNQFTSLRQPAYINDGTSGTISGNFVAGTRGWVAVANTNLSFTGNTWGTGIAANAVDIAFIPGTPNNYDCGRLAQIRANNNNARVDNQSLVRNCVTPPVEQTTVVRPSALNGWIGIDDNGQGGSLNYVAGPSTAPIGEGSAQLKVDTANQGYLLAKNSYAGTKLKDLAALTYSTYSVSGNSLWAPSMQINVTPDVNVASGWAGRLVYEPYINGTVSDGQWQSWDANAGKWWLSKPASFGGNCAQSSPCTLDQLITLYPNVGVNPADPLVGFKAGSSWTNYIGNVDNFHIATANANDRYDFEASLPADTTKPTVQFVSPASGAYNPTNYVVTAADNVKLTIVTANLYKGTTLIKSCSAGNLTTDTHTLTCPVSSALLDGTYTVKYNAVDAAGNRSSTNTSTFNVDHTAPVITIDSPSEGEKVSTRFSNNMLKISGTYQDNLSGENYAQIQLVYQGNDRGVKTVYGTSLVNNRYETSFNMSGLPDGEYSLFYIATDVSGNVSQRMERTFVLDNARPTATLTSPANNALNPSTMSVDATDAQGLSVVTINIYDEANLVLQKSCSVNANGATSFTANCAVPSTLGDNSTYTIRYNSRDMAGNISATGTSKFSVDRSAPTITISSPSANEVLGVHANNGTLTIKGTVNDDNFDYYYCFVTNNTGEVGKRDAKCTTAWAAGTPFQTAFADDTTGTTNGTLGSVDLSGIADGAYTVHVVAKDKAGNTAEATQNFTLDNTAPAVTINGPTRNSNGTYTVNGTSSESSPVIVSLDGSEKTTITPINGVWTYTTATPINDGKDHVFSVTSTDAAGNSSDPKAKTFTATAPVSNSGGIQTINPQVSGTDSPEVVSLISPLRNPAAASTFGNANSNNFNTGINPTTGQTGPENGQVLGTQDKGTPLEKTAPIAPSSQGWKVWGVAWYWYLLLLAIIAAIWFFIGARRRRDQE